MILPTSSWANRRRSPMCRREQCQRIVATLRAIGPRTREYLEAITSIPGNNLRSAIIDCMRAGTVRVVRGRFGKTEAGNKAELLMATSLGKKV